STVLKPINPARISRQSYDKAGELTINHATQRVSLDDVDSGSYQRSLISGHFMGMVLHFYPQLCTPPVLTQLKGKLHCVDGQHRIEAMRRLGATHINAIVIPVRSKKEEVWLFTKLNTTPRKLTAPTLYAAAVEMGCNVAVTIERVLNDHGLSAIKGKLDAQHTVTAIAPLFLAFGDRLVIDSHLEDQDQLARGAANLDWMITAGKHLVAPRGFAANKVFGTKVLKALASIKRDCENLSEPDLDVISRIIGRVKTPRQLQEITTGSANATGGEAVAIYSARLAYYINYQVDAPVVQLTPTHWEKLRDNHPNLEGYSDEFLDQLVHGPWATPASAGDDPADTSDDGDDPVAA